MSTDYRNLPPISNSVLQKFKPIYFITYYHQVLMNKIFLLM